MCSHVNSKQAGLKVVVARKLKMVVAKAEDAALSSLETALRGGDPPALLSALLTAGPYIGEDKRAAAVERWKGLVAQVRERTD